MRLFTRSDLERAARLSLLHMVREPQGDPELAITGAVSVVTQEATDWLTREQAEEAAGLAVQLALKDPLARQSVAQYAERAVRAVLDERGSGR